MSNIDFQELDNSVRESLQLSDKAVAMIDEIIRQFSGMKRAYKQEAAILKDIQAAIARQDVEQLKVLSRAWQEAADRRKKYKLT